jgi:phosphate transport system substrate-binding protein
MKRVLVALLASFAMTSSAAAADALLVTGAGATFPFPLYSKWFSDYNKLNPDLRFNYQSIGSGGGIKQITEKTVDFGASDAPMTDEELAKAPRRWPASSSARSRSGTTRPSRRTIRT